MVRPKASDQNKWIVCYFADTVTVGVGALVENGCWEQSEYQTIDFKGRLSIFQALEECLPGVVRVSRNGQCADSKGISEVEMNKALVIHGYSKYRRRRRSGSCIIERKVWAGRRWVNPSNSMDLEHIMQGLQSLKNFPNARSLTLSTICKVLKRIRASISKSEVCKLDLQRINPQLSQLQQRSHATMSYADTYLIEMKRKDTNLSLNEPSLPADPDASVDMHDNFPNYDTSTIVWWASACRSTNGTYRTTTEIELDRMVRHGFICPELRRFCTFGYCPSQVRGLLAALPECFRTVIRNDEMDARHELARLAPALKPCWLPSIHRITSSGAAARDPPAGNIERELPDNAALIFSAADEEIRKAMERDGETGYLEVTYDPVSQRRAHVFLNDRFAALRGTTRPALLARLAAHTADLPSTAPDCLAALLYGLLHRREADCTQYVRWECGGLRVLVEEHSRKRFDGEGRVVKVTDPSGFGTLLVREQHFAYFFRRSKYGVASSSHPTPAPPQVTTAVREIAPAEYDAALRASPGACPLLCVAGDGRGGAELLADLHTELLFADPGCPPNASA
jgi:hypothetical protein